MSPARAAAIARVAYEARRVFCRALGEEDLPDWDRASPGEREGALVGVEAVLSGQARSPAHLHEALARHGAMPPREMLAPGYEQLQIDDRRKVLLFRAVVLALVDGPCTGYCHDQDCPVLDDHDCHLDVCVSKFGVPPGLWPAAGAPTHPTTKLFC
jgi:hypothetical protein